MAAGLTQEELAERAGLSGRGVQDLERGVRRSPHPATTRRLADALGLADTERSALFSAVGRKLADGPGAELNGVGRRTPRRTASASQPVEVVMCCTAHDRPVVERLAAGLRGAGLVPRTEFGPSASNGAAAEQRGPTVCAVFVGAAGAGASEPGALGLSLHGADLGHTQRLIPVLLPGAPDPLAVTALPPGLATRTWVDLRATTDGPQAAQRLAAAIRGSPPATPDTPDLSEAVCPYRGLEVFEEEHASLFFGRDADVQRVLEQLKASRFLAVVAPSGSGKSSLVRAGLLPALRAGALPASETWTSSVFTPGPEPLTALAAAVLHAAGAGVLGGVRLWDIATGQLIMTGNHEGRRRVSALHARQPLPDQRQCRPHRPRMGHRNRRRSAQVCRGLSVVRTGHQSRWTLPRRG
jgi:DNA-binding XRE family transcriptional regulator